jgi:gamma-glutamyltranspeptidase/glutathione hydrolase
MAALHARHGLLRWEQLLIPAESLARFGHSVSRAFAHDLAAAAGPIAANPDMARIFRNNAGTLPGEGDKLVQPELAGVLSGLRAQGAAYLYSGIFTRRFAEAAAAAGQPVTPDEVRATIPTFTAPLSLDYGDHSLFFTAPPSVNGLLAAQLWQILVEVENYEKLDSGDRAHLFIEASARAFSQRAGWLSGSGEPLETTINLLDEGHLKQVMQGYSSARHTPSLELTPRPVGQAENPHGASFVVADRWNNLVACSLTMNGLFGSFRVAQDTGILLAALPRGQNNGILSPSAALIANTTTGVAVFAGAASGGSAAPTSLVAVMLAALEDKMPLEDALAQARLLNSGAPDVAFYEEGLEPGVRNALETRGHILRVAPELGRVNALYCPNGLERDTKSCQFGTDRRGWGLGFLVQ